MTTTPEIHSRLEELGIALLDATLADAELHRRAADAGGPNQRRRPRRRHTAIAALAAGAIAVPAAALGANALISDGEVASGLPNGTVALIGTQPTCDAVRANVEYKCVLGSAPKAIDVPPGKWEGTVEPIVDASKHVNGGCRSLNADGTSWRCYLGQAAVRQGVVGAQYLGESLQAPVRG